MSGAGPGPTKKARVGVAIPAAGSGQRMGGVRKAFLEVGGQPVLARALQPFLDEPRVVAVVVALGPADAAAPPDWLTRLDARVTVVRGGETRSQSVRAALAALPGDLDVIAVHDAARPLVTGSIVARCIDVALQGFGAVAGCPAVDTMKVVDGAGHVVDTPDRSTLWHAQTPQTFPAGPLREAYAAAGGEDTDDAALVARHVPSLKLKMVDGGAGNLKVTRQADVSLAEAILAARSAPGS
jgi:2-C-methyl-D-erythritol 4-phosphate cytidylyltransferase